SLLSRGTLGRNARRRPRALDCEGGGGGQWRPLDAGCVRTRRKYVQDYATPRGTSRSPRGCIGNPAVSQAAIPPASSLTDVNPSRCRRLAAIDDRYPPAQWTMRGRSRGISETRSARWL